MELAKEAAAADIVRSFQKDNFYSKRLTEYVAELVLRIRGPRYAMRFQEIFEFISDLLYFSPTVAGIQTLGEEYCDLLQYDVNQSNILVFKVRVTLLKLRYY